MRHSKFLKFLGAGALAVAITVGPTVLPATAQVVVSEDIYEDDGFDWGWLGLLGLLGLAGLAGKSRNEDATYRDSTAYRSEDTTYGPNSQRADSTAYRDPSTRRSDATVYRDPNAPDSRNR